MIATKENFYEKNPYPDSEGRYSSSSAVDTTTNYTDNKSSSTEHRYLSELTRWTFSNSEISDPEYINDSNVSSVFSPLPRVESNYDLSADARIEEHFIGVTTSEEAADSVKPDDFALYYKNESCEEVRPSIPLYLVHRSTRNEVFHFPVLRLSDDNGSHWWHVQIGDNKMQSVELQSSYGFFHKETDRVLVSSTIRPRTLLPPIPIHRRSKR